MAISSISDIIISITLILNGLALITSKKSHEKKTSTDVSVTNVIENEVLLTSNNKYSDDTNKVESQTVNVYTETTNLSATDIYSLVVERVRHFLNIVRKFSFIITLWNIVFLFMMIFVFNKKE